MQFKTIKERMNVFVCDPEIVLKNPISGQDFYLRRVIAFMRESGFKILVVRPHDIKVFSDKMSDEYDLNFHMHYVNFSSIASSKILHPKATHLLYVYQLDDPTWSRYEKHRYRAFLRLTTISKLIDCYVTPSHDLSKELSRIVGSGNVKTLEPYHPCDEAFRDLLIDEKVRYLESRRLNVLYVGRINRFRVDLASAIRVLKSLVAKGFYVKFRIISMKEMGLPVQYRAFGSNKLDVELIGKRLTENEKAEIYAQSHILLFTSKGYSAMRPPLSIIESVCYGVVPIISPSITEFAFIDDIVVKRLEDKTLMKKIEYIVDAFKIINNKVFTSFKHFYSKERFLQQLLSILK